MLDCDRVAATERLLQVDADNAAAHVWAITDAVHAGDLRGAREHLQRAAAARRYDPHTSQFLRPLLDSRTGARLPSIDARVSSVLVTTTGSANPADFIAVQSLSQWAAITLAPLLRCCPAVRP